MCEQQELGNQPRETRLTDVSGMEGADDLIADLTPVSSPDSQTNMTRTYELWPGGM
jgi:nucleoside 2-deoxyribosyltransferase